MWEFLDPSERGVLAIRLGFVSPTGAELAPAVGQLATWLVRKQALIGAIGIAIGRLSADGDDILLTLDEAAALPRRTPGSEFPLTTVAAALETEACAVRELSDLWVQGSNPLLVTCGGRALDLVFLRYRCLARGISFPALHLSTGNRLSYFDRYDSRWHLDLADFLAGQGATQPLMFDELCGLCQFGGRIRTADLGERVQADATSLFSLLTRTLHVMGRCSSRQIR
ncbi:MAG: hypothetical protein BroJett029_05440 [Alphaproteobacteria bacterium]|nr:MAG: hypothetical protein BroJett029_05440 [Alphaproteobacteria bacterium]